MSRRRAYRYAVTGSGGEGEKAIGTSPFMLDWKYLGRVYTWNIVGGETLASIGWIEGKYIDKGYIVNGKYQTDDEIASATAANAASEGVS